MARSISAGKLPEGWNYGFLDDFSVRCSGHTPSKSHPEYWNGGIKWISLADSHRLDKGYVYETDNEISLEGVENSSAEIHPAETVVLSRDAGIGKSGVMAQPMAVSQHFIAWICDNKSQLHSWFLYNWLQHHKREFERQAVGSTIKTIGLPYFKKLKIALPPFPEQKKIAQILSTWDQAITATERLLENSQQRKKGLMQQLLTGKKRLPGFEGEWRTIELGSLGSTYAGLSGKTKEDFGTGEPFVTYMGVFSDGSIKTDRFDFVRLSEGESQNKVQYGDILFTTSSETPEEVGMASVLLEDLPYNLYLNSFCFGFRLSSFEALLPEYARYLFRGEEMRRRISALAQGATRYNLSKKQLVKLDILLPGKAEQEAISQILTTSDMEISAVRHRLVYLREEKKALMQQLLTGKRRVNVDTEAA